MQNFNDSIEMQNNGSNGEVMDVDTDRPGRFEEQKNIKITQDVTTGSDEGITSDSDDDIYDDHREWLRNSDGIESDDDTSDEELNLSNVHRLVSVREYQPRVNLSPKLLEEISKQWRQDLEDLKFKRIMMAANFTPVESDSEDEVSNRVRFRVKKKPTSDASKDSLQDTDQLEELCQGFKIWQYEQNETTPKNENDPRTDVTNVVSAPFEMANKKRKFTGDEDSDDVSCKVKKI